MDSENSRLNSRWKNVDEGGAIWAQAKATLETGKVIADLENNTGHTGHDKRIEITHIPNKYHQADKTGVLSI
jgi:hypothetical protein